MQILLPLLLVLSAYYLSKYIRTNSIILYIAALLISAISIMLPTSAYTTLVNNGTVGVSFLLIVMFTGALKRGSQIKKRLSSVRREYAILGFMFIVPHSYLHIYESIIAHIPLDVISLLAVILMVPLFVTSFKIARSKMATSSWIQLHKIAHIIYLLIFLHAIRVSDVSHIIPYYIIFGTYFFLKLYHRFSKYNILKATTITVTLGVISLVFVNDAPKYFIEPMNIIEDNHFQDGTYIGYSKGYQKIDTVVRVSIQDNTISYVIVDECGCTPYVKDDRYVDTAYAIANEIKDQNRTDIDAITGATDTSYAINEAVIDALKHALIK